MSLHANPNVRTSMSLCRGSFMEGEALVDCEVPSPSPLEEEEEEEILGPGDPPDKRSVASTTRTETSEIDSLEAYDVPPKKLGRMEITEVERQWALDIKAAVEADTTLTPLCDMEYVQHAIIAKHKVAQALKRIRKQQAFRIKHGIVGYGDVESGIAITNKLFDRFPGGFMNFAKTPSGSVAQFVEVARFLPAEVYTTEEHINEHLHALYYTYAVMQCDIEAIREGSYWVADAEGLSWKNFCYRLEKRAGGFCDSYPIRFKGILAFDAPRVVVYIYNFIKPWLSPKVRACIRTTTRDKFLMENDFPDDVLPISLGGSWNPDNVKKQVAELLQCRYHNLSTFRL